ncbi:MAG: M1 family metallopeptidase [Geminicoccaceae bacterium]
MQRPASGRHFARLRDAAAAAALLIGASYGSAHAIDDFFPTFGNAGIDVRHYAIRLDVEGKGTHVDGRAVLNIRATQRLKEFSLDLSHLKVQSVEIDGIRASFSQKPGKLVIRPARAIPKGDRFKAIIVYAGAPRTIPDPTVDDPSSIPGLGWSRWAQSSYVVSEPVGAGTWYPVNDEPTDKASYRFTVVADEPYTAIANGVPVSVTDLGKRRRYAWEQRQPMASYLAITDIGEFKLERGQSASGVPVRNYITAGTPPEGVAAVRKTAVMVDFVEKLVGRYPFDGYGSVLVDDPNLSYALETQAMSTFPSSWVDELTVVHELAHQWFGDSVTVAEWRDLWLAEGFATYFEFLWEYRGDQGGFDQALNDLYAFVVSRGVGPAVVSTPQELFAANTYYRGALTLEALRRTVGDKAFWRTVRQWYQTYRNGNATSGDFIKLAAGIGGNRVRPLLHAWLYEQPVPPMPGVPAATALAASRASEAAVAPPKLGKGVRRPPLE